MLQEELVEGDEAVVDVAVVGKVKCARSRREEWIRRQRCSMKVIHGNVAERWGQLGSDSHAGSALTWERCVVEYR